jgi:integrase
MHILTREKYLNESELQLLVCLLAKYPCRDTLLLELLLATGARASEILSLKKSDIDLKDNTIFIKSLKGGIPREMPIKSFMASNNLLVRLKDYMAKLKTDLLFPISL